MKKTAIILSILFCISTLQAGYAEGKRIFAQKCSSCHAGYTPAKQLKENFFERNNTLLHLKAPTVNMLAYALIDSPTHIGDSSDPEMQEMEIEEFLKEYLYHPDRDNSICDKQIMRYYETKESLKGKVTPEEILHLAQFFMQYKAMRQKSHPPVQKRLSATYDTTALLKEAQAGNKLIIIEASASDCHFCKKMKREVIETPEIQQRLRKDFILVEVDIDKTALPFGLKRSFKGITPTFFFLDKEGKLLSDFPGSWGIKDFKLILDEHLKRRSK